MVGAIEMGLVVRLGDSFSRNDLFLLEEEEEEEEYVYKSLHNLVSKPVASGSINGLFSTVTLLFDFYFIFLHSAQLKSTFL